MKQSGFFDVEERLARLSGLGDQLEAFSRIVDFEVFRPDLDKAPSYSDGRKGGRSPFDPVLMFKILVIQTLNNRNRPLEAALCLRIVTGNLPSLTTSLLTSFGR
ncbi:transposase [Acetobacter tropicalis NRIC 0312]|uniref:Transposase InsH N-terminal domain-containing protein n=1 Tax=Acetobacter tropicalis TaxID=104102 RepID=A0A511FSB8_9PROT|nr:transposase [Acetobacter tropicalis]GBR72400.1 transposase [Acetobacter tropicalis NRIC 0312]GEL51838.1 hypothetical protein ATR01nite_29130 [Acetobacter tropicalis]